MSKTRQSVYLSLTLDHTLTEYNKVIRKIRVQNQSKRIMRDLEHDH
jgi:hypothetical protein